MFSGYGNSFYSWASFCCRNSSSNNLASVGIIAQLIFPILVLILELSMTLLTQLIHCKLFTPLFGSPGHVHGGWSPDLQPCVGVVFSVCKLHGVSIFSSSLLCVIIEVNIVSELPIKNYYYCG